MTIPGRRVLNLAGFLVCAGMIGFAMYAQYVLLLDPCPLCILQRIAVIAVGAIFLLMALHDPNAWGRRVYAVLLGIAALAGVGVAGWHVRLQHLPPAEVPACGPGLNYMLENFPLGDALRMIFEGSGECAAVAWKFLGLSMPAWVLISIVGLGAFGLWNGLRRVHTSL